MFDSFKSITITCANQEELENLLYTHFKVIRFGGMASSTWKSYGVTANLIPDYFDAKLGIKSFEVTMPLKDWQRIEAACRHDEAIDQILSGSTEIIKQGTAEVA